MGGKPGFVVFAWVLEELRVPVEAIAGTSMGALVGGAYASGMTVAEMQRQVLAIRTAHIVRDDPPRQDQSERRKRDDRTNFLGPEFGIIEGSLSLPKGAVSGIGLEALLRGFVRSAGGAGFDDLPIPLRVVATDIETGSMRVLAAGDLASALRASSRFRACWRRSRSTAPCWSMAALAATCRSTWRG